MKRKFNVGNVEAVNRALTHIQEAYEFVRKTSISKLPEYQNPGHLSEFLLELDTTSSELALEIAFTVLLAPGLDYLYPKRSNSEEFLPQWNAFFNTPIGDDYHKFIHKQQARLKINAESILKADFSPNSSTTYGEAYQLAFFALQTGNHRKLNKLFNFWLDHIERHLIVTIKVPLIYIDEIRIALTTELKNEIHDRGKTKLGRHKSAFAIDQITAARILLHFAEKMRTLPYNNHYVKALICLWIVLRINHLRPSNTVGITEIQSQISSLPSDIGPEYHELAALLMRSDYQNHMMPSLTKDIINYNFKISLHERELCQLGDITGDAFKSFPHTSRFLRIPQPVIRQMRTSNLYPKTCELSGRQLLSSLEMPCMATARVEAVHKILNPISNPS